MDDVGPECPSTSGESQDQAGGLPLSLVPRGLLTVFIFEVAYPQDLFLVLK